MNPRVPASPRLTRPVLGSQTDERLTELARGGSDAAFEAIVARYRRPLLRHCARVVGDTDAEEAVQDALLRAHGALSRGDAVRDVKSWLHVVAHNAALNILRARRSRPECAHAGPEPADREDLSPLQREALREVLSAVSALPVRQRDAIVMRELEGRSYDEIADQLGTSNGAVRQLLNRARNAVRDRIGAFTVLEPLARLAAATGNSGTVARVGALSGGCALTAKLCTAALLPAMLTSHGLVRGHTSHPAPVRSAPAHAGRGVRATASVASHWVAWHSLASGGPAAPARNPTATAALAGPSPTARGRSPSASVPTPHQSVHDVGTSTAPASPPERVQFTREQPTPPAGMSAPSPNTQTEPAFDRSAGAAMRAGPSWRSPVGESTPPRVDAAAGSAALVLSPSTPPAIAPARRSP